MTPKAAAKSKKKTAQTGKGKATATKAASGAQVKPESKLEQLEREAAKLPPMIRPRYKEFDCPSGQHCIIKKIQIGARDEVIEGATVNDDLDMALFAKFAISKSMVDPAITPEQVSEIDPDDFEIVWKEVGELSYGKVGQVVNRFRNKKP